MPQETLQGKRRLRRPIDLKGQRPVVVPFHVDGRFRPFQEDRVPQLQHLSGAEQSTLHPSHTEANLKGKPLGRLQRNYGSSQVRKPAPIRCAEASRTLSWSPLQVLHSLLGHHVVASTAVQDYLHGGLRSGTTNTCLKGVHHCLLRSPPGGLLGPRPNGLCPGSESVSVS